MIGAFPRTTPQVFLGERSIDFARTHAGAAGRAVSWATLPAEPSTGRVDLEDLKRGAGQGGETGYEVGGSPDLCAFAYTELDSDREGPGLMLLGSSGTLIVTVNEQVVLEDSQPAGRAYAPDAELVRVPLVRGRNRILVQSRQGIGRWAFSVQVARGSSHPARRTRRGPPRAGPGRASSLRHAARRSDPRRGGALFFDPRGIGCGRCHSAGGRGSATIGPDLTSVALKYDRAELIRSVLEPSSRIAVGYQPVVVATHDGRVHSGIVHTETADMIDLDDAEARITRVPKKRHRCPPDRAPPRSCPIGSPSRSPRPRVPT